ncbi:MAG: hypothetical protein ABJF09_03440 [Qipengyuania citrea]|jgi:hypothetical protein|uniref:hypothetical protein n=1 Tax=Alphaproteobacteria TaxID=28211 RepID=UPI00326493B8|nr:hypothetical protein [Qipengyuania citrea]|tara:strand:- start:95076 stop:95384 length:309 start_codon:yes stop_codon:yes gene_type:complete
MTSSSTALVPWTPQLGAQQLQAATSKSSGGKSCASPARWSTKTKWLIAASVVLALGAAILGSMWFGFAAVLPLLYLFPCLAMMAMCMKGMKSTGPEGSGTQS